MRYMIEITGSDKVGIVAEISTAISEKNANIYSAEQSVINEIFNMKIFFSIESDEMLNELLEKLNKIEAKFDLKINVFSESEIENL